jgi:hypothetical protein
LRLAQNQSQIELPWIFCYAALLQGAQNDCNH